MIIKHAFAAAVAMTCGALPSLALDVPMENTVDRVAAASGMMGGQPVELTEHQADLFAAELDRDMEQIVFAALRARGQAHEGWRLDTQVGTMDLRYRDGSLDPRHSALTAVTHVIDAKGDVVETIPMSLIAYPAEVSATAEAKVVPPSMDAYYAALLEAYAAKVVARLAGTS